MVLKKRKPKCLMSIDPSINNLGVAVWDIESKALKFWKLIHPKPGCRKNEYSKSVSMVDQLKELAALYGVVEIVLEVPEHWSVGGFEARETGSIAKLCFVCGLIYSMQYDIPEFELVTPRGWKGQLPKAVVANRLRNNYTEYGIDLSEWMGTVKENIGDAIGIGHYKLHGGV